MLSRSEMRMHAQAARNGWETPVERRRQAVRDVQAVLDSADASERETETARSTMTALEEAGWTADMEDLVQ
jgi:hypothetical protein